MAAHSLAELYATLSSTPAPKMRRLTDVLDAVEHAAQVFTPVTLSSAHYLWVLRHVAGAEARSGSVYDALILKCGELAEVDTIYTWNVSHFKRVSWTGIVGRIRTP